ncbi:hypothetical protein [Rothia nasimurium]|uniref:hypothetical protein n=1 Tax=Rothia nasimurium TaxID=85336 RepID=UPI002DD6389E|nr:hypothetical protein [Rothia nasimurium]
MPVFRRLSHHRAVLSQLSMPKAACAVRGAATLASFERQQSKIVQAINKIDTSVLSPEEIENTLATGHDNRDIALNKLVEALNKDAGYEKWAAVALPSALPASEDVIHTAFIYQPAEVKPIGESAILDDAAFSNARQPLAQALVNFTAAQGGTARYRQHHAAG